MGIGVFLEDVMEFLFDVCDGLSVSSVIVLL